MSKSAPVMGALWGHRGDMGVSALPGLLVHLGERCRRGPSAGQTSSCALCLGPGAHETVRDLTKSPRKSPAPAGPGAFSFPSMS